MKRVKFYGLLSLAAFFLFAGCSTTSQNTRKSSDSAVSRASIQEVVKSHSSEIRNCYEAELLDNKNLRGRIGLSWSILPNGSVADVAIKENTLNNQAVESCVMDNVRQWKFPAYEAKSNRDKTAVDYPFEFDNSEELAAEAKKPKEEEEDSSSSAISYVLDRDVVDNAVAEHTKELMTCYSNELKTNKGLRGVITVSWTVKGDGSVGDAKVTDTTMENQNVENCILDSINKWKFPATGTPAPVVHPFEFEPASRRR